MSNVIYDGMPKQETEKPPTEIKPSPAALTLRKIAELDGEESFDLIMAATPLLPVIMELEVVNMYIFGRMNEEMSRLALVYNTERTKKKPNAEAIAEAGSKLAAQSTELLKRDVITAIPALVSKERRGALYEVLSILSGVPVAEIKVIKPHIQTITKAVSDLMNDEGIRSFLPSANAPELTA